MSASTENGDDNGYVTGGSLRSIFRAEIQSVLKPPKEAARLAEIEESVKQLMAKVTTKKSKPSASSFKPPPRATQSARERPPTRDMGVQEESWQEPSADAQKSFLEVLERPVTDAPPEPEKPPPELLIKNCVYEEVNAADLRETVREARKKLFTLDTETTRLNRELKECRMETWRHQRNVAHIQSSTSKLIDEHRSALPAPQLEEELALEREECELQRQLTDARAQAVKWSSVAKRQDSMLQQEREQRKGKDVEKIFRKHPAGEIFILPAMMGDNTDDSDYEQGPRGPRGARTGGATRGRRAASPSSDEGEEEFMNGGAPGSVLPPPPAQRWRATLDDDSLSEGSGSALPSPSESGGGSSRPSPSGAVEAPRPELNASSAESSSDEGSNKASVPLPAPVPVVASKTNIAATLVPPLPGLAGGSVSNANADDGDEENYSSDDIEEEIETSRSI